MANAAHGLVTGQGPHAQRGPSLPQVSGAPRTARTSSRENVESRRLSSLGPSFDSRTELHTRFRFSYPTVPCISRDSRPHALEHGHRTEAHAGHTGRRLTRGGGYRLPVLCRSVRAVCNSLYARRACRIGHRPIGPAAARAADTSAEPTLVRTLVPPDAGTVAAAE